MARTYDAAEVDTLLNDLYGQVEAALSVAEDAHGKAARLEAEHAIELQKVASRRPSLDPALIDATLEHLEDLAIIAGGGREKIASELLADPNNALRLIDRLVTLSAAPQQGAGIPKTASTHTPAQGDPDGWNDVLRNGA